VLSLVVGLVRAFGRDGRRFDAGAIVRAWVGALATRYHSDNLILNLGFKKVLLVSGRRLSEGILEGAPSEARFVEGRLKKQGMSFLAPRALTITHGERWSRLRAFNEYVLDSVRSPAYRQEFLDRVRDAFGRPITSSGQLRDAMGEAMLGVVFGEGGAPERLASDMQVLFGVVQSPIKRKLLGFRYAGRRERLYRALRQCWDAGGGAARPSLLRRARERTWAENRDILIQQVPHWMFTFTGSGTDLLVRTLALITSRADTYQKVKLEIQQAGSLDDAETIGRLRYVEACLLETGRLFPPVPLTFHRALRDQRVAGCSVPAGVEIVQYLPLLHRGPQADRSEDGFHPDSWLDGSGGYSDLFLRGARACPGRDLILFVCKSAIALQIGVYGVAGGAPALREDPLPVSFPRDATESLKAV
jgi:cytochrome P450